MSTCGMTYSRPWARQPTMTTYMPTIRLNRINLRLGAIEFDSYQSISCSCSLVYGYAQGYFVVAVIPSFSVPRECHPFRRPNPFLRQHSKMQGSRGPVVQLSAFTLLLLDEGIKANFPPCPLQARKAPRSQHRMPPSERTCGRLI